MNLGENIYRYRTANKLSQGDLADSLSVSRQSVSKWENNSAQPELDKLIKMSNLFQLSLDELVFGNAPPANASTPTQRRRPQHTPLRIRSLVGISLLVSCLAMFLPFIFGIEHLSIAQELGIAIPLLLVEISLFLLYPHSHRILAAAAVVFLLCALTLFGFRHTENNLASTLYLSCTSLLLLVWFISWGQHASGKTRF